MDSGGLGLKLWRGPLGFGDGVVVAVGQGTRNGLKDSTGLGESIDGFECPSEK